VKIIFSGKTNIQIVELLLLLIMVLVPNDQQ